MWQMMWEKKGAAFDVVEMPENTKVPTTSLNKMIRSASHCHNTSVMNIVLSNMQHKEAREGQMGWWFMLEWPI